MSAAIPKLGDNRLVLLTRIPSPYRTSFFNTLANSLHERGFGFHVLYCAETVPHRHWAFEPSTQHFEHSFLRGVDLRSLEARIGRRKDSSHFRLHVNPSVISVIRSLSPKWLISGGSWNLPTALLARLAPVQGMARVLWSEGHPAAQQRHNQSVQTLRRLVYSSYDGFAVPNARSADYALQNVHGSKPIFPLANTVDEEHYTAPQSLNVASLRARLGVREDARVLVSVCQLEDRKAVLELSNAYMSTSPADRRGSILVFLGDGPLRSELDALALAENIGDIRVLGHVQSDVVRDWLWASDVFVLPTRRDPNPLSPIEASFAGLPLLVSNFAGNVDELVHDNETGWRFTSIDGPGLQAGLERVLQADPGLLRQMGVAAYENAHASFRRRHVSERFLDALLESFPAV